jgi:glutamate synthase domain-containing protein 2
MVRLVFLLSVLVVLLANWIISFAFPPIWWSLIVFGPLAIVGFADMLQTRQTIRRNFPVIGNLRYFMELVRPEIQQYFVESNTSGTPFNRLDRSLVYQRSKGELDTIPFGTQKNVYETGYEWVTHSLNPAHVDPALLRVTIGSGAKPYSASIFNIGAMSFGSLSANAVAALNQGAKIGGFAQNTGEGGLTSYHTSGGGDIIWQIGTGYFGCRTRDGKFSPEKFAQKARIETVRMIEIKLSQGAKPGHGGILPAAKLTKEIAEIRGVPMGESVISPPAHSAFSTPVELLQFVQRLRDLSGGKPVGFKLCIG